ncbi:MAG: ornithine--oxo-acid transaminase [Chlamydiae bacterium]|nr:ornithine--oxo-acid transaminase [Chlamydiota bacterium]
MTDPRLLEERYGARNYHPLPVILSKGKGIWVYDIHGKKYMDLLSAYSAISHGHCHPRLLKVLQNQSQNICVTSRAFFNEKLGPLLKKLCELSHLDKALPMNSGAEAVETAIKAARRWGYTVKKIPENKAEIIVAKNNFHGRTTAIISFSSEQDYKKGFGPFLQGFVEVPYSSAEALEKAITPNTCAVLLEPMQGEAGIIIPPPGYLKKISEICKKNNVLLILDEIQTGLCRTGKMFAFEHENIVPDGVIIGKALGGGILPVSAFVTRTEVMDLFTPGSHGSTFGGSPLSAAVALEALLIMEEDHYAENSQKLGEYLLSELKKRNLPFIRDIRGKGLWIGVDFDPAKVSARKVCEKLMEKGILAKETHQTVVRIAPPLIITKEEVDLALSIWDDVMLTL